MVIYFSKINLVSDHIFQVYDTSGDALRNILSILLGDMRSGIYYEENKDYIDKDGNLIPNKIRYNLKIQKKDEESITGVIYKKTRVLYKDFQNDMSELVQKSIVSFEGIRFYFDVYKETIGFCTTNRFGYQEFNRAFAGVINTCLARNRRDFVFDVALRTEGLSMDEIENQLHQINGIKELKFKFQPPNPDEEILDNIEQMDDDVLASMRDGNVTEMSFLFSSKSPVGLNLHTEMIQKNFDQMKSLYSIAGNQDAIGKGYISIEAIDKSGKKYTTANQKPVKVVIDKAEEFLESCKSMIRSLI